MARRKDTNWAIRQITAKMHDKRKHSIVSMCRRKPIKALESQEAAPMVERARSIAGFLSSPEFTPLSI